MFPGSQFSVPTISYPTDRAHGFRRLASTVDSGGSEHEWRVIMELFRVLTELISFKPSRNKSDYF